MVYKIDSLKYMGGYGRTGCFWILISCKIKLYNHKMTYIFQPSLYLFHNTLVTMFSFYLYSFRANMFCVHSNQSSSASKFLNSSCLTDTSGRTKTTTIENAVLHQIFVAPLFLDPFIIKIFQVFQVSPYQNVVFPQQISHLCMPIVKLEIDTDASYLQ